MAFPVVESLTATVFDANTTAHLVDMPATVNTGDLLVCFFSSDGNTSVSTPGDWTQLHTTVSGTAVRLGTYYKIADGTEDGTTVDFVTGVNEKAAAHVYRISGWHGTTPPEVGTAATGLSVNPDPPSLTPSWGADDTLWLVGVGEDNVGTTSNYPTSYTNGQTDAGTAAGVATVATARRALNATTEDPDTFTIGASDDWVAQTVAIRPAAGAGTQNLTGTLFTKTPTFNTGTITSVGALTGVLFQRVPAFPTGVVSQGTVTATRFYIPAFNTPDISPAFSAGWEVTDATVRRTLKRAPQDRLETGAVVAEWLLAAETSSSVVDVAVFQAVSDPIGAGAISGFVKGSMSCRQSAAGTDARAQMRLFVVSDDGSTVRGVLLELDESVLSNEWNTGARTRHFPLNWTGSGAALSQVTAEEGDRIVCEVGFRAHNVSASSLNGEIRLTSDHLNTDAPDAEDSLGTSLRGWIEFSQPVALPAAVNTYETELRAKGVLFHWPLDETSGTVLRDGEQKHSQFVTGGAPTLNQAGPTSLLRAVSFDGVDDYTYANPTDEVHTDASGVVWVKTDTVGQGHGRGAWLVGENGNPHFIVEQFQDGATWKWNFHYRDDAVVARDIPLTAVVANQWEFIAFTLDGDAPALRVYMAVGGVVTEQATDLVNISRIWFADVRLGTDKNLTNFGDYVVAGPALFDSTLTVTDLQDIYNAAIGSRVSQIPNATTSNDGWDTAPLAGQAIHTYIATDDSDYITVTVP